MQKLTILEFQSAPFNGPMAEAATLLDQVGAPNFEGLWVPTRFLKSASLQLAGSMSTMSVQLYGSNALADPLNTYTVTIGGTVTASDVVTLNFTAALLPAGTQPVSYTVQGGDTAATIATALATAVNANANLQGIMVTATAAASVVTIQWPSISPVDQDQGSPARAPHGNSIALTASVSGAATETATVAVGSDGALLGAAITALGLTVISPWPARFIKARLTTLTGTTPSITALLHGVG